ncbi:MAG: sigma-70 family RNA polymerase sigma factor [Bacteroidales bacterium]|nr:sigma-70 family RNA polymerase sigma factor [Bacteroidales bacterium]
MTAIEFNYQLTSLSDSLKRFALSLTSNHEDASDLLQETFLKAISYRDKFADDTNLKAWTFTIMKNTFINNYRRIIRSNTTFDHTDDLYYLNLNQTSDLDHPDSTVIAKEIKTHIESLEDDFKIPFEMHLQGFKYKEIASKLGLKLGTVKSRIFFTRKKLADSLGDDYN